MPSDTLTRRMNPPRTISGSGYRSRAAMSRPWAGPSRRKTEHPTDWRCTCVCRWRRAVTKGVIVADVADAGFCGPAHTRYGGAKPTFLVQGFEPLVSPLKRDGVFRDYLDRPPPLLLPENQARGTEGSNPVPSSAESAANLTPSMRVPNCS